MSGNSAIGCQITGAPVASYDEETLYSTIQGDFSGITRIDSTTLEILNTPAHLGVLVGGQFMGVTVVQKHSVPFRISRLMAGVYFDWNDTTNRLTVSGATFPVLNAGTPDGIYNILYVGKPRETASTQDGLIVDETNQAVATYTETFNLGADGFNVYELWVESLTASVVTVQSERPGTTGPVTYEEATLAYHGVTFINTTGVKKADVPMQANTIRVSWTTSNPVNATKIYLARGRI